MKICLIIPPKEKGKSLPERTYGCSYTVYKQPDLALLYLASALRIGNFEISYKDFTIENSDWNEFDSFFKENNYDAFTFHSVLLSQELDIKAARIIRQYSEAPIVFFGPQPTFVPENFLTLSKTFVLRGEVEETILDLMNRLINGDSPDGVPGVSYKKSGGIVNTGKARFIADINRIPFPARDLVDNHKENFFNPKLSKRPLTTMLTTRGCPYRCIFCVPNSLNWARELEWKRYKPGSKPPIKIRSAENVIREFRAIKETGYNSVSIIDDMFLLGEKRRIISICDGIKDLGLEFGILARCDHATDPEIMKALKTAGCKYVDLGIESFDPKILEYVRKDLDVETIEKSINNINKHGLEPKINIMFGTCPLETKETIKKTIRKTTELPVDYAMFSITTPFPGTDFEKTARKHNWIVKYKFDHLPQYLDPAKKSIISYPHLSDKEIEKLTKKANRKFYLRPGRIWKEVKKIRSFKDLKDTIKAGLKIFR